MTSPRRATFRPLALLARGGRRVTPDAPLWPVIDGVIVVVVRHGEAAARTIGTARGRAGHRRGFGLTDASHAGQITECMAVVSGTDARPG
jgi:hypothetical protein